ncbi:hypothetical protein [Candidatus Sneabacter namystus]|nr:hypothetical protein [Candidatus Sneabacter namystus]
MKLVEDVKLAVENVVELSKQGQDLLRQGNTKGFFAVVSELGKVVESATGMFDAIESHADFPHGLTAQVRKEIAGKSEIWSKTLDDFRSLLSSAIGDENYNMYRSAGKGGVIDEEC